VAEAEADHSDQVVTGFAALDRALGGALPVGPSVTQGAPGTGKTCLAQQIAGQCGAAALFVAAEMRPVELFRRSIARTTYTALSDLAELAGEEIRILAERTATALERFAMLDSSVEWATISDIRAGVTELRQVLETNAVLVVVDSLQVWARNIPCAAGDYEQITAGVTQLRELAYELEVPLLLISHRNRAGQKQGGMYAAKGTGDVEYAAEVMLELETGTASQPDGRGEVPVTLTVLKNRRGPAGATIRLKFAGATQRFREG